jgi:bifunctional UDP-N-acetylglucosamine pyrophosphorylase / glucosamine-1-phosphate N-acetyltransferase
LGRRREPVEKLSIVILAAGRGERMVSSRPKVMHGIMAKPMIDYVVERARELNPERVIVVTGFGGEIVETHLEGKGVLFARQAEQRGTAHAVLSAGDLLGNGSILILYGDVPLIERSTLEGFLEASAAQNHISFMTTEVDDPGGYGRVISQGDEILEIVEDNDATPEQRKIRIINTGICIIPQICLPLLRDIKNDNKKGEYYLTDICKVAGKSGIPVRNHFHLPAVEVLGINTRQELLEANLTMKERILEKHMRGGVTFVDRSVYIEEGITIGRDTVILPNTHLTGTTSIGENVSIGPNSVVKNSRIDCNVVIEGFSVVEGAEIAEGARIGPFSRIRPSTFIGKDVRIGNFVEVKNSTLKAGTKANHLAYIGDAEVGTGVNIGAGTITCNYDGKKKHKTFIDDNVFVGSNTELVAPVRVGKDAIIGAGSTITRDVPEGSLAVSRVQQKHIEGYGRKKRCAE